MLADRFGKWSIGSVSQTLVLNLEMLWPVCSILLCFVVVCLFDKQVSYFIKFKCASTKQVTQSQILGTMMLLCHTSKCEEVIRHVS